MHYKKRIALILLIFLSSLSVITQARAATAIFAGGCFWCLESDMDKVKGVTQTIAGYTGGQLQNPTYQQVSAGGTGHYEALKVIYDPAQVSYPQLLNVFWHSIDPTDGGGQFCDRGDQYRSAIFYVNSAQKNEATASKNALIKSGQLKQVATLILPASTFYPAEEYHQNYYLKNPVRYKYYRYRCGRDQRVAEVWGNTR